jgi:hypothetical protein
MLIRMSWGFWGMNAGNAFQQMCVIVDEGHVKIEIINHEKQKMKEIKEDG